MIKNRVAANKVLVDKHIISTNLMVERDESGVVINMLDITCERVEPHNTLFYNGLITADVDMKDYVVGIDVPSLIVDKLEVGYGGRLFLWQNLSLSDLKITADTKVIEL